MESSEGLPNSRSSTGKEKKLRIVGPFTGIPPSYISTNLSHAAEGSDGLNGSILKPTPTDAGIMKSHHQRCSSESFLSVEEQPSWLEDLLDEPESPLWKGHRRSASDSSAYLDTSVETFNRRNEYMFNNFSTGQPWGSSQNYTNGTGTNPASVNSAQSRSFCGQQSWASESSPNSSINFTNGLPVPAKRDGSGSSSCGGPREDRSLMSTIIDHQKQDRVGSSASQKPQNIGEKGDQFLQANNSASKADAKHAKQKTAHRSRVRKLQYIAELERNVQVLQAEGSAIFAEIEFLDQHNLILSMENSALRQRLDSLSQEQLIKQMQHEMLEREIARLQALFQLQMQQQMQQQQQQQQQQQRKQLNVKNNRAKLKDLDSQFGNLSVSSNEASSSADSTNASTRI